MYGRQNLLEIGLPVQKLLLRGAAGQVSADVWSLHCMKRGEKQTAAKTQKSPLFSTDCQHHLALMLVVCWPISLLFQIQFFLSVRLEISPKAQQFQRA